MVKDENIIQSLIVGGIVGAALGTLISKDKGEGVKLGALAGAVLLATYEANKRAQSTNTPLFIEENGKLYKILPGGNKTFIRNIPKPARAIKKHFKLQ